MVLGWYVYGAFLKVGGCPWGICLLAIPLIIPLLIQPFYFLIMILRKKKTNPFVSIIGFSYLAFLIAIYISTLFSKV
jgi:uncharacterized RDD family membrane protein YckC